MHNVILPMFIQKKGRINVQQPPPPAIALTVTQADPGDAGDVG